MKGTDDKSGASSIEPDGQAIRNNHSQLTGSIEQPDRLSKPSLTYLSSIKPYPYLNKSSGPFGVVLRPAYSR